MRRIFGYKVTESVANETEVQLEKSLDEITEEEFESILDEFTIDSKEEFIWTMQDLNKICTLDMGSTYNDFFEIRDLGIYVAEDSDYSQYHNYGEIGDTRDFMEWYITYYSGEYTMKMKGIENLIWFDEDNMCKKAVDEFVSKFENDQDGVKKINFNGNKDTSLIEEIENYLSNEKDGYEEIGIFLGKTIYRIKDRLYYLTEDSYSFNGYYNWTLQEAGTKCYDYFDI